MNQHIILISGRKGTGKDTLAEFLRPQYTRIAFADNIYEQVAEAFDFSVRNLRNRSTKETPDEALRIVLCGDEHFRNRCQELGLDLGVARSPRNILQLWGTEYAQDRFGKSYWADQVVDVLSRNPNASFVIPDLRFNHEAEVVYAYAEAAGAKVAVFRVERNDFPYVDLDTHVSETELEAYPLVDLVVYNETGKPELMIGQIEDWIADV